MNNPWTNLNSESPYTHSQDEQLITLFNANASELTKLRIDSIPDHFIGDVFNAKVIALLLNPGHADSDLVWQANFAFRECMFKNLLHKEMTYPFYPLDPRFKDSGAGRWWFSKLSPILKNVALEKVSKKFAAVEWFPYHSVSFKASKVIFPSQTYGFTLVQKAIDSGKIIVVMRSLKLWRTSVVFKENPIVIRNPRNPVLSSKNLGEEAFNKIISCLNT